MRKKTLVITLFLFVPIVLIFLIFLNINFLLNTDPLKERIFRVIENRWKIKIVYAYLHLDLLRGDLQIKEARIEKLNHFKLDVFNGTFVFSLSKFLRLEFSPETVRLKGTKLKIYHTEEPADLSAIKKSLKHLYPLNLFLDLENVEYQTPFGWIDLNGVEAVVSVDKGHLFWMIRAKEPSIFMKKGYTKGQYDLTKDTLEGFFHLEGISFESLDVFKPYNIKITLSDLSGKTVLTQENAKVSFDIDDLIVFKEEHTLLKGKTIKGALLLTEKETKLELEHLIFDHPKLRGSLIVTKEAEETKGKLNLKELDIKQTLQTLSQAFYEYAHFKEIDNIFKKGFLKDVDVIFSGKDLHETLSLRKLKVKGEVSDVDIFLEFIPLSLDNINGKITFENGSLEFEGEVLVENLTKGKVETLKLDLKERNPSLTLSCSVVDDIKNIEKILTNIPFIRERIVANLKDWNVVGRVDLGLILKGKFDRRNEFDLEVTLNSQNLEILSPFYPFSIYLEKLVFKTDFDTRVILSDIKAKSEAFQVSQGELEYHIPTSEITISLAEGLIDKKFLKFLEQKEKRFRELIMQYDLNLTSLEIEVFKLKEHLDSLKKLKDLEGLIRKIFLKGKINGLELNKVYKDQNFLIKAKELFLETNNGSFKIEAPELLLDDSMLKLRGKGNLDVFNIEITGKVKDELKTKLEKLISLEKISFRTPIVVEKLIIDSKKEELKANGVFRIGETGLSLALSMKNGIFEGTLNLGGKSSNCSLSFSKFPKEERLILLAKGDLLLDELEEIFLRKPPLYGGEIFGELRLDIEFNKGEIRFNPGNSISFRDVKFLYPNMVFLGNGTWEVISQDESRFKLDVLWNNSTVFLDGISKLSSKPYKFSINLKSKKLSLKLPISEEKKEMVFSSEKILEKLRDFPILMRLNIEIEEMELPTEHMLGKMIGSVEIDTRKNMEDIWIELKHFEFCGIKGEMISHLNSKDYNVFIEILPSKGDFLDLFSCLYPREMPKIILEGPYLMKGYVFFEGNPQKLITQGSGELTIDSKNGYIYRAPVIASVLGFLSPVDLFKGKIPNLENQLLPYEELILRGRFVEDIFYIENSFISAAGFRLFGEGPLELLTKKLYLTFYVSPFKTIDVVIEKLPGIGRWLLGKPRMLVYLPLQVVGTYDNYNIIPLHPSSVGKGIFDFIFRIFGVYEDITPVKVEGFKMLKEQKEKVLKRKQK